MNFDFSALNFETIDSNINAYPDIFLNQNGSYKQNSELLELFQHASKCNANPDILWTDNADFGNPLHPH